MQFFLSNPTPFDWFMLIMSYGVGIPATIYAGIIWYRMRRARREKEREREEFWREYDLQQSESETEQSKNH